MIRYFLPKKVPKFAMFGPGLESSTSKLVRQIMYTDTVFHTVGLFPGQFDGKYLLLCLNFILCKILYICFN